MHRLKTKKGIIALLAVIALIVAACAVAAWIVASDGAARGKAGTLTPPTVSKGLAASAIPATPGNPGSLSVSINNPAANGPLVITGWTINAGQLSSSDQSNCPAANFNLNARTLTTPQYVAVPTGVTEIQLPMAMTVLPTAPSACQGVTVDTDPAMIHILFATS